MGYQSCSLAPRRTTGSVDGGRTAIGFVRESSVRASANGHVVLPFFCWELWVADALGGKTNVLFKGTFALRRPMALSTSHRSAVQQITAVVYPPSDT